MGNNKGWLKARERHRILIAEIKRIAGGSFIAALIVGPLIYFSVVAMPLDMRTEQAALDRAATPDVDIAAETEVKTSITPLPTPTVDPRTAKIIAKSRIKDLKISPSAEKFAIEVSEPVIATAGDLFEEREIKFESFFGEQDAKIKEITLPEKALENRMLVIEDIIVDEGPAKIDKRDDAEKVAEKALQQYLKSEFKIADFRVFKDTSILDKNKKPYQFVLGDIKRNNGKWYVTYNQYSSALPVFDGNIKFIFTEGKKLLVISDNIKRDLPAETEFKIGKAVVEQNVKQIFEWDDTLDKIEFIDKGYFKGAPAYRAHTNAHNPAGNWEIFVEGVEGKVEDMNADIRLQDEPATPEPEPSIEPEIEVTEEETPTETPEEPQPTVEVEPTVEPETPVQPEPEIVILDIIFSQILGKIYPQTPSDDPATEPLAHSYAYIDETRITTDKDGYFENPSMAWYSTFLDGPYVTVRDDDATSNIEIVNQTPAVPFLWDENSASLAAINAFYHTNKIRDYFAENHGYEINKNVPLTVNSKLVDAYINGCGAWFNNSQKTIEMGRGGTEDCPTELNYALGSDFVYHEYAHFVVEEVTHLPYILGSETAAMSEGLSDYFATTINNDSVWGDVIAPSRQRNLENTLNYNTDRTGSQHRDGMIFSGALWDLRKEIGAEATDALVFNTLFQDRYSFETFMYGMIIEDDDNGDFSDGTPHLAEIITAFENHGIGPGIANFNGLPLTPEAWAELLGEEIPEGEEEELLGAWSGDCTWSGGVGTNLTVPDNGICNVTGTGNTAGTITIAADADSSGVGGQLRIGSTSSGAVLASSAITINDGGSLTLFQDIITPIVAGQLTVTGNVVVNGDGKFTVNSGGLTSSISGYLYLNATAGEPLASFGGSGTIDVTGGTYVYYGDTTTTNFTITNSSVTYNTTFIQTASTGGGKIVNTGGTINIRSTGATSSYVNLYTSTLLENSGTITVQSSTGTGLVYLYIRAGATVTNSGTITVNDPSSAGYTRIDSTGSLTNSGTYTNKGAFNHYGSLTNSGTGNFTTEKNATFFSTASANNSASGASMTFGTASGHEWLMTASSTFTNSGTVTVYDDFRMSAEAGNPCTASYTNNSGATTNIVGTTTNKAEIRLDATITNAGTFNVDYAAGSTTDGFIQLYENASFTNSGTFRASRIFLGDVTSAIAGGTITNNSGGKIETSASTSALDIYMATLNNCSAGCASPSTTLVDMVNNGYVRIAGVSGDRGYLDNYGTAEGRFQIEDYGSLWIRNGGLYTATLGNVYGDTASGENDGILHIYSGGELSVTTLNIGSTSTSINSGIVKNDGYIHGATLNVYEDATSPNNDYELTNNIFGTTPSALIDFTTINLGTILVDGGEIYNRGGDGSPYPTDTTPDGIVAAQTNIYGGGRIYNGKDRTGAGTANLNAEYNYELATSNKWTMDLYDGGSFDNYGYVGGAIDTESPIILASPVAVRYDAQTANFSVSQVVTGATSGATGTINSMYDLGTYGTLGLTSVSGTFLDNETVTSATGSATVNMEKTFINKSGGDVETRDILMKHSGFYNNYGATTSTTVAITGRRGTMNLASPGSLTVTGTTGKDLSVASGGTLNAFNGNTSLTAESVSIINDTVSTDVSNLHIYSNSGTIEFDTVSVGELGSFNVNGNSPTITSDLSMEGTSGSRQGKVVIADTTDDARLTVEGKTAINSYGVLENNAIVGLTGWGFRGYDIVAVKSGGTITSDTTSDFNFGNGIASAGTVLLADNMEATNNSTSTYAIEVTGGTFAMGTSSNTGTSYTTVGSSSIGNVMVTGGTFTTYNNAKFDNVTVTGSGSVANFEDSTSPTTCKSDIHGYFDILAGATAEINCSNTVDPAVYVHSGSPGGNTQVEGTLILNTNLTTETMVVGRLSTSGTVTHDSMTGSDDPTTTFVLTVSDTLTINTNGSLDVTGKANYRCSTGSGTRGGTYGGRGQYNGSTGSASTEYGNVTSWLEHFGCGGTSGEENFWGRGGGIMNIYVGSVGNGSLINNGSILANGMSFSGIYSKGGGSGGSINIAAFNTVSGSGSIAANGGGTSASPDSAGGGGKIVFAAYDKSAYTGSVSATGGYGSISGNRAGTGTIFYGNLDVWQNHNDGTLVIDGFSATGNIDVDLDSTTITSDAADDATKITADTVDVESVQLDRYGALYFNVGGGGAPVSVIKMQQCIASNGGFLTLANYARATYNRDTTPVLRQACIETSDPPAALYINDSTTGAQSNFPGGKTDPIPSFADLTPATSAKYKEATLDRTGTAEGNGYDAFGYEILIGTSTTNVYNDIAIGTSDECNFSGTMPNIGHDSRSDDILVPSACGNYLTVSTPYYWKIRFMEDLDFDLDTTNDQYWGLWSATNHFEIDEGGTLTFDSCATGITQFSLGPFNTIAGDNFDYDYCTFNTDATVETYVQVNKDGPLTHTDTVDPGGEIRDMGTLDYDTTSGLDGRNAAGSLEINELGFYLDNINTAEFTVEASGTTFQLFTDYYHYLPDIATTIFTSSGGYSNESFDINIGAFVHGLINAAEPTASYPTSRCSTAQGAPCITRPGDYIAEFTITLTLNP